MEEDNSLQESNQQDVQKESTSDRAKEMGKKVAEKATKKLAGKGSLMAPLAHILMIIAPILIAVIIIIGIISFLVTMPGMVMDKLKGMLKELGNFVASFYGADTTAQIDDTEIYETLDYLEQMGYDLKGFGFLTEYVTDINAVSTDDYDNKDGAKLDSNGMGVIRNDNDNIIYAKSDFIFTYIMSDNYMYTLANDNIATIKNHNGKGSNSLLDKIIDLGKGIATVWYKFRNAVWGPVFDALGITDGVLDKWGTGLIKLYYDTGTIGVKEKPVNQGSLWNLDSIKINVPNNTLSIARGAFLNSNNPIEFSLDGWSGRYGMPMEFLLSVHLATMMPDLAYDMATSFPTNVNVYLHKTKEGEAVVAYKTKDGKYITYEELSEAVNDNNGHGPLNSIVNWFKKLTRLDQEILNAFALGMDHHEPCDCTFTEESFEDTTYYIEVDGSEVIVQQDEDGNYYTDITNPETIIGDDIEVKSKTETITMPSGIPSKPGPQCSAYIEKILSVEKWQDDPNYLAYIPYIHSVTNHWYRDVYFVEDDPTANNENIKQGGFVDYDYDYEALTGERWTLYETYGDDAGDKAGEFVLYKTDGTKFDGTIKKAQEQGIAVSKKPIKIDANEDTYEDLGWNNKPGKWVAYEDKDDETSSTGYERLYTDAEVAAEEDEDEKTIKGKLYVDVSFKGNVVQKGEGLRTETNSLIKKMFLENQYYKYDGTAEIAEVITALREKGKYGALDENALKKEISVSKTVDGESKEIKYKASEVSGRVSLNQDSLNAFSMLENTHTLDADYIYRDFKELIVELGYFEKEELTDETPRLLQFLVPDIDSGGFPNRSIDKNENEFGTMVHSEGDIKANEKNTLKAIIAKAKEEGEPETPPHPPEEEAIKFIKPPQTKIIGDGSKNIIGQVASLNSTPITNLLTVGAIKEVSAADYTYKPTGSSEQATKIADLEFNGVNYECWFQTSVTCTLYSFAFVASAYTDTPVSEYIKEQPPYWCPGLAFASFKTAGVEGVYWGNDQPLPSVEEQGTLISEALDEGKPVFFYSGFQSSGGEHAVVLLGANDSGKVLYYNPWGGVIEEFGSSSSFSANLSELLNSGANQKGGHLYSFFIPAEPPEGVKKSGNGSSYSGYKGNEAVVSPVTGILLDYGTYDGVNDKSNITDELYRQNVDLKYQKNPLGNDSEGGDGGDTSPVVNPEYDPSKPDLVGYAKILVLDAENYKKLEAKSGTDWAGSSLVYTKEETNDSGNKVIKAKYKDDERVNEEEKVDELSEIEKTVYGYKEFAESYQAGGISGYVVYIDGFECYKPDTEFTDDKLETEAPSKDDELKLTLEDFKSITTGNVGEESEGEDKPKIESLYEKDENHKMASKKATEKLKATTKVKEDASPSLYVDDLIFIKEGTIIGRTITDFQLIEEYRGESGGYSKYRTVKGEDGEGGEETPKPDSDEEEEDTDAVIGNYLRIILRDLDDSVVEDVETYMKLDDEGSGNGKKLAGDTIEEKVWLALLDAGYSEIAAAGVMGNIYGESGFNSAAIEGGSGEGHGLCQWSFGRKEQLFAFAAARGVDWTDEDLQVEFLLAELTPGGGADGHANYQFSGFESYKTQWENATNIEDATTAFCAGFERPSVPRNEARIEAAQKYYDMYAS